MNKKSFFSLKRLLLWLIISVMSVLLLLTLFHYKKDEKKFTNLTHRLFVEEMTANTLSMHYALAEPARFGIYDYDAVLPGISSENSASAQNSIQTILRELSHIRPQKLSENDAYTYKLLTRKLTNTEQLNQYSLYQTPLAPSSGMQSQLPVLLAEYSFRTTQDIEDYLNLLDQTDDYFASLLAFEQEKLNAGLSMSAYSLHQTRKQCDTIVTKEALKSGTHFLQTTFEERLTPLINEGILTKEDALTYIAANNHLLETVLQPSYEALADGLFLMKDTKGIPAIPTGLSARSGGKEYYQYLLVSSTGSYRTTAEIKCLLQDTVREEYRTIVQLVTEHPELTSLTETSDYTKLPCQDASSILTDLQNRMQSDFPALPADNAGNHSTEVNVKPVSVSLQEYCAPAFYLTTPLDNTDSNVIYINHKNPLTDLELYTTLAHEGYPGHLYQTVYNNRDFLNKKVNKARQLLWYGGYLEGWAVYVEFYGYDYASALQKEQGYPEKALCIQLEKHNRSLILCIYSMLDIMIHDENATIEDVADFLENFGIDSPTAAKTVYCYIADEPCNYLKYYLGYLEILELKKEAGLLWKDSYSDYAFHSFYLNTGPSDFSSLLELLVQTPSVRHD